MRSAAAPMLRRFQSLERVIWRHAMEECQSQLGGGVGASGGDSGGGSPLPPENDQQVAQAVRQAYFLDPVLPEAAFDVISVNRVVYLRGVVASSDLKRRAEEVASQVQGVTRVVNELQVAQPSPEE